MGAPMDVAEVEAVIDERIRPYLSQLGGDIQIISISPDIIKVRLLGQCCNCPNAISENEEIFEMELCSAFPGLKQVVLEAGVSDDLYAFAKELLKKRHREE